MHDDEQLLTLAKEAVDFNTISETLHKNKKYMAGGDGAHKQEEIWRQQFIKKKTKLDEDRKLYD